MDKSTLLIYVNLVYGAIIIIIIIFYTFSLTVHNNNFLIPQGRAIISLIETSTEMKDWNWSPTERGQEFTAHNIKRMKGRGLVTALEKN